MSSLLSSGTADNSKDSSIAAGSGLGSAFFSSSSGGASKFNPVSSSVISLPSNVCLTEVLTSMPKLLKMEV